MKNTKLFLLLSQLSSPEQRDLQKFVQSPYFNNRKKAIVLLDIWLQSSNKKREALTKSALFQHLYPREKYKDEKIRLVMTQLVQLIEDFLVIKTQRQDTVRRGTVLASIYRKKNLKKPFVQTLKSTLTLQKKQSFRSAAYYFDQYRLHFERFSFNAAIRTKEQNLQAVSDTLDMAFIIMKLRQVCVMLSHQTVFQKEYKFGVLPQLLDYIQQNELLEIPAIAVYYHYYLALTGKEMEVNFRALKKLIVKHHLEFPPEELRDLYILGVNICIRIINEGNTSFLKELVDLYKKGLESDALLENGILSRFTYQNIVSTGIRSGEYEWSRAFLYEYKDKVETTYRESAYRFNLGRLAYHQKRYGEALELLRNTDHEDLLTNVIAKNLLLKIYYELKEFKLLDSFLDAFQIYLKRKKVIGYHREHYRKMIYFTQKLTKVNPFNKEAKQKLRQRMETVDIMQDRDWLLEKLDNL